MAQKKDEPAKTRTIWVAASKYNSENDVEIEEVHEQEQEEYQEQDQEQETEEDQDSDEDILFFFRRNVGIDNFGNVNDQDDRLGFDLESNCLTIKS